MSGSPTKREPPGKLTSDLLARKGQARPADLLDGDSLLVTSRNRPPLTLIRSEEPATAGLFGDHEAPVQDASANESGSLLDFSLARPESGATHDDAGKVPGDTQAAGSAADPAGLDTDGDVGASAALEPAVGENELPPLDLEDAVSRESDQLPDGGPAKPAAAERNAAEIRAAGSNLPRALILAVLLVVSFAAGLWIVSWANRSPTEGAKDVNLPLQSQPSGQNAAIADAPAISNQPAVTELPAVTDQPAISIRPTVTDQPAVTDQTVPAIPLTPSAEGAEGELAEESRATFTEQVRASANEATPAGADNAAVLENELNPKVPAAPPLPTAAGEASSLSGTAPVASGDPAGPVATLDPDPAESEPRQELAADDQAAVAVLPKPKPERTPATTAQDAANEHAAAGSAAQGGYVVQLLAGRDLKTVTWEKDRLLQRFPQLAGRGDLEIIKVESENRPTFYRVRTTPFDDAGPARSLCRTLKQANQDCLVLKQ